jgi:hypothetical protein
LRGGVVGCGGEVGALFGGAAGGGAGFGRWRRVAARGLVPFGARCLGSVPDVDRG